jgi:hypothetical protein
MQPFNQLLVTELAHQRRIQTPAHQRQSLLRSPMTVLIHLGEELRHQVIADAQP